MNQNLLGERGSASHPVLRRFLNPDAPMTSDLLLIAVHGWMLSRKVWAPFEESWTRLGTSIPLWCPDLPGFGLESRPPQLRPTLASYGRWLAEQIHLQAKGRQVVLMGHSLGGSIALHAETSLHQEWDQPLSGLVMLAAGGGIYQPRPFRRLRFGGQLILKLRPKQCPGPIGKLGPFQAEQRAALGLLVNSTTRGAVKQIPNLVAGLKAENLWISGEQDRVMEPGYVQHLAEYSPKHCLKELKQCGHLAMQSHPDLLAKTIHQWLIDQSLASPRS